MDSQYIKDKKAKGLYYNDIYFGSTAEYDLYKCLLQYNDHFDLYVHKPVLVSSIDNHRWKLDFTLSPRDYKEMSKLRQLLYICNEEMINAHISEVYIEYKGYSDQNFRKHINRMINEKSDKLKVLIIVSDKPSAYIYEFIHTRTRYKKLICSFRAFQYWINDVYCE